MAKETQMAKKDEASIALQSFHEEFGSTVQIRQELLQIARIKLTQSMSDASRSGLAREGEFACDLKGKNYGKEITIIPLLISESASMLFNQKSPPRVMPSEFDGMELKDGEILCSSRDLITSDKGYKCKECPFNEYYADWGSKNNKHVPSCKTSIDVICLVDGEFEEPMFFNFRKNNYKAGKALVNFVVRDPMRVAFGTKYTLKSEAAQSNNYKFSMVSQSIEKKPLTQEEILKVLPAAKRVLEAKKKGEISSQEIDSDDGLPV